MEHEVRFYFPKSRLEEILNELKNIKELKFDDTYFEKTIQFDNVKNAKSFYSDEIDGRFRVRISKSQKLKKGKISWKRRIKDSSNYINTEEEIEVDFNSEQLNNLAFLLENVIGMRCIESYERYRNIFENEDIEIAVDEYPFGIALEIENKNDKLNPKENILKYVELLGLDYKDRYLLSWDDKYKELCRLQNKNIENNVLFEKDMPQL